jgi:iron-only hydrogenase group A
VGAFEAVGEFEDIEKPLLEKDKTVVVQFAPSIRATIGEEFNLPSGSIVTGQLVAALRKLGFNKVFDVSVGADFTTVEEAEELIERLKGKGVLPMFTSCCPAWVKFVEFYYPEFIPHLTTARSPHMMLGALIKKFWAKTEKIDPKKVVVVSIMPCVAKKYEIKRDELRIDGINPVDYVLTTRELACLLTKHKIDLKNISPQKADNPLGSPTGAGVIYGATGGVTESALRTTYEKLTGKKLSKLDFKNVRGIQSTKEAVVEIKDKKIKVAVINGMGKAKEALEKLRKNKKLYDYVEVMACFGGCIGGGGQPLPTDAKIRAERVKALYKIDTKKNIRLAHENPIVKKLYKDFLTEKELIHSVFHTKYFKKKKEN